MHTIALTYNGIIGLRKLFPGKFLKHQSVKIVRLENLALYGMYFQIKLLLFSRRTILPAASAMVYSYTSLREKYL